MKILDLLTPFFMEKLTSEKSSDTISPPPLVLIGGVPLTLKKYCILLNQINEISLTLQGVPQAIQKP